MDVAWPGGGSPGSGSGELADGADTAAYACLLCRKRKRFCDRALPSCALCVARRTPCLYLTEGDEEPEDLPDILRRAGKKNACEACKSGKKACDGESPCGRCAAKNLDCVFVARQSSAPPLKLPGKAKARPREATRPAAALDARPAASLPKTQPAFQASGAPSSGKRKRDVGGDDPAPAVLPPPPQFGASQHDAYTTQNGHAGGFSGFSPATTSYAAFPPFQTSAPATNGYQPPPGFFSNPAFAPTASIYQNSIFTGDPFGAPTVLPPTPFADRSPAHFPADPHPVLSGDFSSASALPSIPPPRTSFLPGFAEHVRDAIHHLDSPGSADMDGALVPASDFPAYLGTLALPAREWHGEHGDVEYGGLRVPSDAAGMQLAPWSPKSPMAISDLLWDSNASNSGTSPGFVFDAEMLEGLLPAPSLEPERAPGSWWPPLPTPPFTVARPVVRPGDQALPPDEVLRDLVREFFEDYHPTFPILHRQTFLRTCFSHPHLFFAVCLLSTGFSKNPHVLAHRTRIEISLFLRCTRELRASIERTPDRPPGPDEADADTAENCIALGFVALWAYRRGYASLQQSAVALALRLARAYGLNADPGDVATYGARTPRDAYVRRELRRKAWATIWSLTEFISSITGKEVDDLAKEGRGHRIPPRDAQWDVESEDPAFVPPPPGTEFRPRIHELVDWMDKGPGEARSRGVAFGVGSLARRSLVIIYLFGFLRLRTNQFLAACKAAGISPVDLQGDGGDPAEGEADEDLSVLPRVDGELSGMDPAARARAVRRLRRRARKIEGCIDDILRNLPAPLREAEADGDADAMVRAFQREVAGVPHAGKSVFARALYLSQIRLFRLELRTSYGVLSFQEMGKLAGEWHRGSLFQDCLESAIVYTRLLRSLLRFHPSLNYISITTGLYPLKIGAFHLAVLQTYRAHARRGPVDPALLAEVERDLGTCLQFLDAVAANHSEAEWWASRIVDTLRGMVRGALDEGGQGAGGEVEVSQVYLRSDAPDAPAGLGDG